MRIERLTINASYVDDHEHGISRKTCLRSAVASASIVARDADMAQQVEHHLAQVGVAGSNPVVRSTNARRPAKGPAFLDNWRGDVAKW